VGLWSFVGGETGCGLWVEGWQIGLELLFFTGECILLVQPAAQNKYIRPMTVLLYVLAILPGILLCVLIFFADKYEREGFGPLLICFGLGMLCSLPALGIQKLVAQTGIEESTNVGLFLINVFLAVAFSEELVKLVAVLGFPYRQKFFNEPLDGIVYTIMIGMGFATVENVIYAYKFGMETTVVRAFTAVPSHAIFAVVMGYFIGMAKFSETKGRAFILRGFLLAVLIHGLYDFFILQEYYDWLMGFGLLTLILGALLSWKLIKVHQRRSPFKESREQIAENRDSPHP